jgi:hypothetical protein
MGAAPLVVLQKTIYTTENGGRVDAQDGVETRALGADLQPAGAAASPLSVQANTEGPYRAVSIGPAALTVWQDDRSRAQRSVDGYLNADIWGARLAIQDNALVQSVGPVATVNFESYPAITWDGALAPIAYQNFVDGNFSSTRALAHLLPSGAPDGKAPVSMKLTENLAEVQLLPNGTGLILAGLSWNSIDDYFRPVVHRLSAAGAELDAMPISVAWPPPPSTYFRTSDLSTALLGGTLLLVWQDTVLVSGFDTDQTEIHGSLVTPAGLSPASVARVIAKGPDRQAHPALATDGTSAAVLWIDRGDAGSRLQGARVDATLARLDASDVTIASVDAPERLGPPALAWTGTAYAAAWTRTSGGTLTFEACLLGTDLQCQPGTQTSTPSTIAAVSTPLITAVPTDAGATGPSAEGIVLPELTWTDAGGVLFYLRHDTDPLVNQDRLFARPIILAGTPPPGFDAGSAPPPADAAPDAGRGDGLGADGNAGAAGADAAGAGAAGAGAAGAGAVGGGAAGGGGAGGGAGGAGAAGAGTAGQSAGAAGATATGGAHGGPGGGGGTGAKSGGGCSCDAAALGAQASWLAMASLALAFAGARRRQRRTPRKSSSPKRPSLSSFGPAAK